MAPDQRRSRSHLGLKTQQNKAPRRPHMSERMMRNIHGACQLACMERKNLACQLRYVGDTSRIIRLPCVERFHRVAGPDVSLYSYSTWLAACRVLAVEERHQQPNQRAVDDGTAPAWGVHGMVATTRRTPVFWQTRRQHFYPRQTYSKLGRTTTSAHPDPLWGEQYQSACPPFPTLRPSSPDPCPSARQAASTHSEAAPRPSRFDKS